VHEGAVVEESIIFDNCDIGPRARIRRTILDEGVVVPNDAVIGHDMEQDHRQYYVSPSGIVVVEGHPSVL
jgi:glucose-1-phosphate adenylyltransferase